MADRVDWRPRINILVVGAGGFGRHYLHALAGLSRTAHPDLPPIARVIVSRTRLAAARRQVAELAGHFDPPPFVLEGVEIRDGSQLRDVLAADSPALTCIAARDPIVGDAIHMPYAVLALEHGAVLCEKPLAPAGRGDKTLAVARTLLNHPNSLRFGLELPMAVVAHRMWADSGLRAWLDQADDIEWLWQRPAPVEDSEDSHPIDDPVNDLAVHPWSLIPDQWQTGTVRRGSLKNETTFSLALIPPVGPAKPARMRFSAGVFSDHILPA